MLLFRTFASHQLWQSKNNTHRPNVSITYASEFLNGKSATNRPLSAING